jgi:hypothetical protein
MTSDCMRLANDPRALFPNARSMFAALPGDVEELQLAALQCRFDSLVGRLPLLARRADQAGIASIGRLDDAAKLLYPSNVYKSYPLAWLESGDYVSLTGWVQQLTTHDLSSVGAHDATSLDTWFAAIEAKSPLRLCHSSATSGKLSFVPRAESEWFRRATTMAYANEPAGHDVDHAAEPLTGLPIISPFYRAGHSAFLMSVDWNIRVHGDESKVVTAYPGSMSSDLLVLGARLRALYGAEALRDVGPSALADGQMGEQWNELRKLVGVAPATAMTEFVSESQRRFGGEKVWVIGVWPSLVDAAVQAAAVGSQHVFCPDSIVHTGGGTKGCDLPGGWKDSVTTWLGVPEILDTYGMSEVMGMNSCCPSNHYHLNAWTIPYVFDPTGKHLLPRAGRQTGRFGAVDLLADSYWGGFLSTDEVTLTWDQPCECGRFGPYLDTDIRRVLDRADQKVSCAATPDMHNEIVTALSRLGA